MKTAVAWRDGKWVKTSSVSAFSHALNYSCGVFDTARFYPTVQGPAFFRLGDHVKRLVQAAAFARFDLRYSAAQIQRAVVSLSKKNRLASGYLRMNAFLPQEQLRVFPSDVKASLAIMAAPLDYSGKAFSNGLSCLLSGQRKPPRASMPSHVKFSANYLPSYLALMQARAQGFHEAILLDSRGFVAEATAQNLFIVKNGVLFTPSTQSEILAGVTRDSVMVLARDLGLAVKETDVTVRQLVAADEVFLTGTAIGLMPVNRINKKRLSVGPVTTTLKAAYDDAVFGRHGFSKKWLMYV